MKIKILKPNAEYIAVIESSDSSIPESFVCNTFSQFLSGTSFFVEWYLTKVANRDIEDHLFSIYRTSPKPLYTFRYLYNSRTIDPHEFTITMNDLARLLSLPASFNTLESRLQILNIPIIYENVS